MNVNYLSTLAWANFGFLCNNDLLIMVGSSLEFSR